MIRTQSVVQTWIKFFALTLIEKDTFKLGYSLVHPPNECQRSPTQHIHKYSVI